MLEGENVNRIVTGCLLQGQSRMCVGPNRGWSFVLAREAGTPRGAWSGSRRLEEKGDGGLAWRPGARERDHSGTTRGRAAATRPAGGGAAAEGVHVRPERGGSSAARAAPPRPRGADRRGRPGRDPGAVPLESRGGGGAARVMQAARRGAGGSARGPHGGAHARREAGEVRARLGALQGGRGARRERPETQKESFLFAEHEAPEGARPQQQQQRVLCDPLSTRQGDQTHLRQLQSGGGRPGR